MLKTPHPASSAPASGSYRPRDGQHDSFATACAGDRLVHQGMQRAHAVLTAAHGTGDRGGVAATSAAQVNAAIVTAPSQSFAEWRVPCLDHVTTARHVIGVATQGSELAAARVRQARAAIAAAGRRVAAAEALLAGATARQRDERANALRVERVVMAQAEAALAKLVGETV